MIELNNYITRINEASDNDSYFQAAGEIEGKWFELINKLKQKDPKSPEYEKALKDYEQARKEYFNDEIDKLKDPNVSFDDMLKEYQTKFDKAVADLNKTVDEVPNENDTNTKTSDLEETILDNNIIKEIQDNIKFDTGNTDMLSKVYSSILKQMDNKSKGYEILSNIGTESNAKLKNGVLGLHIMTLGALLTKGVNDRKSIITQTANLLKGIK